MESCDHCQCGNKKLKNAVGGLHPVPVKPKLFHQLGMDLIGPLPETPRGNKYIVTQTDYLSKWAEAAPLPSKHADGIARFIYSVSILACSGKFKCKQDCIIILIILERLSEIFVPSMF